MQSWVSARCRQNHIFRDKLHARRSAAGPRSAPEAYTITDPHVMGNEDIPSFQRQQRHSEPVAGDSDHYGRQAPTTDLWQHHPPAERAECLLCSLWGTKQHHCTEDSTSSRRPGDDAVPEQREEIPQLDQCTQSSGSWQHSWACTERLCSGTHWCLHRHFQHITKSGCCPHMLQSYHHHSSHEEVISILFQWLPSSSTHSYSHEVLWTASHATHQVCPPPLPGTLPVCI